MRSSLASTVRVLSRLGGRVFTPSQMARAYALTFGTRSGKEHVLPDLMEFTGALDPAPKDGGSFAQGRAAGRRDVWLHIMKRVHLTDEEQVAMYAGRSSLQQRDFK